MSPDPIRHPSQSSWDEETFLGTPQRWNEYAYVLNNPLNATDPTGGEVPVWEKRLEGTPTSTPRQALTDVAIVGAAGAMAFGGGELAGVAAYARGLLAAAYGYFLSPQGQQTATTIADIAAPPGTPSFSTASAAANFGFKSFETAGSIVGGELKGADQLL
jgi:hypothetical protein